MRLPQFSDPLSYDQMEFERCAPAQSSSDTILFIDSHELFVGSWKTYVKNLAGLRPPVYLAGWRILMAVRTAKVLVSRNHYSFAGTCFVLRKRDAYAYALWLHGMSSSCLLTRAGHRSSLPAPPLSKLYSFCFLSETLGFQEASGHHAYGSSYYTYTSQVYRKGQALKTVSSAPEAHCYSHQAIHKASLLSLFLGNLIFLHRRTNLAPSKPYRQSRHHLANNRSRHPAFPPR
jgi:hypothetical protein